MEARNEGSLGGVIRFRFVLAPWLRLTEIREFSNLPMASKR